MSSSDPDLVLEEIIAREYGESALTWRNRRRRGEGPPHYRLPGKRSRYYYSRAETAQYYKRFRVVPVLTARLEERQPESEPPQPQRRRPRSKQPEAA